MIEVLAPGPLTTVQDGGRTGWLSLGVPTAGPADWLSHTVANRLVGNPDGAAALELTLSGPRLRFTSPALVAVVGAAAQPAGGSAASRTPRRSAYAATASSRLTAPNRNSWPGRACPA